MLINAIYKDKHQEDFLENQKLLISNMYNLYINVNKNKINLWNINLLLNYGQENLTRCMQALLRRKNKHNFYTVYSYEKFIENYLKI